MEKINKKSPIIVPLLVNKKWLHDFEVIKEYECGIKLEWYEVKSLRAHQLNLKASFVTIRDSEVFIQKMHISQYKQLTNPAAYDPERERKLMLHKKEIASLLQKIKEKWFTIIPTEVYLKWNLIKVKIALAKWRKEYDKKNVLKNRDIEMDMRKSLKEIAG
jgi:SsrA-binding protein